MAYVMNFGEVSFEINVLEKSGKIVIGHVLEGEVPEFSIFVWVHGCVVSRVLVTSVVSQPHIISLIGQHKGRSFILVVDDEGVAGIEQTVL